MSIYGSAYSRNSDFWSIQREKVGIGLQDLAQKVGVEQPTLNNWFRGSSTPRDRSSIYKLCKCLQIDYYTGLSRFDMEPVVFADTLAKHGITAVEIREVLGLSKFQVSSYINKKTYPDHKIINAIADLCGIDRNDFFRELNAERLSNKANRTSNDSDVSTPDASIDTDKIQIPDNADKIHIPDNDNNQSVISNRDLVKEIFNTLYDVIDIDDLLLIIKYFRESAVTKICWDDILDFIYYNKEVSRSTYDSILCLVKDMK